jgi:hypothetical protein
MWLALISLAVFIVFLQSYFSYHLVTDYWQAPIFCLFLWKFFFNSLCGVEQATNCIMTLPCTVSSKLNQKTFNIECNIFHLDAWWRLPIHLIWPDECSHVAHTVLQGMMETAHSSYMSRWMSTCHSHSGSRLSKNFIPKSSTDADALPYRQS